MFFPFVFFLVIDFSHIYVQQICLDRVPCSNTPSLPVTIFVPFFESSLLMFSHCCTQQYCIYTNDGQKNSFIIGYSFPSTPLMMASIFFTLINMHRNLFLKCVVLCVLTNVYNQMYTDKQWSCSHCLQNSFITLPPKFYCASFQSIPTIILSPINTNLFLLLYLFQIVMYMESHSLAFYCCCFVFGITQHCEPGGVYHCFIPFYCIVQLYHSLFNHSPDDVLVVLRFWQF